MRIGRHFVAMQIVYWRASADWLRPVRRQCLICRDNQRRAEMPDFASAQMPFSFYDAIMRTPVAGLTPLPHRLFDRHARHGALWRFRTHQC